MSESIGMRVKTMRKQKNMTQMQLAEKTYISESYIALIELDKRNPSTDVVIKLAEVLGVSSDYLLFGDMNQNDIALFKQWKLMTEGRAPEEIEAAQKVLQCFFENLDRLK